MNRSGRGLRPGWTGLVARLALMLALSLLFSTGASTGVAQAEGWGYDLGDELMSPFCPGRTLSSCPSPQAAELVQWIVTQEAAGATREEVIEILIERFGEEILGAPPAKGITLWAYVFPVAGFALFGAVAFVALRRIVGSSASEELAVGTAGSAAMSSASTSGVSTASGDDDLAALVDADLARRG